MTDQLTTSIIVNDKKEIIFDYQQESTPLIVPYYDFQNIVSNHQKIDGVAISENLANKLGITNENKKTKIKLSAFVPVQEYNYVEEVMIGDGMGNVNTEMECLLNQTLVKKIEMELNINYIVSVDDYYNEFLDSGRVILVPGDQINDLINTYQGQIADDMLYANDYNAVIEPYTTKNYLVEIDQVDHIKDVEDYLLSNLKNAVVYDQYNSVIDTTQIYKQQRKDRLIFIICAILVAIVLYCMVLINLVDQRKKEMKLLSLNGLNSKNMQFILRQDIFVQIILSLIMTVPSFILSRKWGFMIITQFSLASIFGLYFVLTLIFQFIIFIVYEIYIRYFRKQVLK